MALLIAGGWPSRVHAQRDSTVPPREYFLAFAAFYEGEYEMALDAFRSAARGGVRSTEGLWVDSICYHTMAGECFYQMGEQAKALEQFNSALKLAVFHSNWMLRIEFPDQLNPSASTIRSTINWGATKRATQLARVPATMLTFQGRTDNDQVLRQGGVVGAPEFYPLNAKEIVRCTAVAMRRRLEIMGPVCQHDALTSQLVTAFSRRPTRPNHWSQAWVSCELGLAYASAGRTEQAVSELSNSLLLGGQYDHELTGLALLELGHLAFKAGQYNTAATFYLEATFVAAAFDQFDVMADGFRSGLITHLVSGQKTFYAPLGPASAWSRRYSRALQAELYLLGAENYAALGETAQAIKMLTQTRQTVGNRDMRNGMLGIRFNYQSALINFQRGAYPAGTSDLSQALTLLRARSQRLFQIALADAAYVNGTVSQRVAEQLFEEVLREPAAADWSVDPMETLATVVTPHPGPLQHWFEVAMVRRDEQAAIAISDRIRRHRFFSTLPLGGRLLALRWILESPEAALPQSAILQRQDLLARYPNYAQLSVHSTQLQSQLDALPLVPDEPGAIKQQSDLLGNLAETSAAQERILSEIALRREPSDFVFPPLLELKQIQDAMPEGQLMLAFLAGDTYVSAFALTREQTATWQVDSPDDVRKMVAELLQQMGVSDRKVSLDVATLRDGSWKKTSADLLERLSDPAKPIQWEAYRELVIVPDNFLWYVPWEALQIPHGASTRPLVAQLPIRCVPTMALANAKGVPRKPKSRTAVVTGPLYPGQEKERADNAFKDIEGVLPGATRLEVRLPGPSSLFAATCDRAIVLSDLDQNPRGPHDWYPLALDKGTAGGNLESWLGLPWQSPTELVLPGYESAAGALAKGRANGSELFLAACDLMGTGARTVLLSRWNTGGRTAYDLVREFAQELPYAPAAQAWRRSIQVNYQNSLEPDLEPRLNPAGWKADLKASHPYFWSSYILIDTGSSTPDAP